MQLLCLVQKVDPHCQVQFSSIALVIVIVCNLIKVTLMIIILWRFNHPTLVTIGDAISSFLERPDPYTRDLYLLSKHKVTTLWSRDKLESDHDSYRWRPRRMEKYLLPLIGSIVLLRQGLVAPGREVGADWNCLGSVNTEFLITLFRDIDSELTAILIANTPQAIVSFIYLTYNGIFTCMLAEREWAQYSVKRSALRVTVPRREQTSTYFLQVPYRFGVPLLSASALLHFFISQPIFVARVAVYKGGHPAQHSGIPSSSEIGKLAYVGNGDSGVWVGVGYSTSGILASIILGTCLILWVLGVGFFCKYPNQSPLGGTNSAVISAACHLMSEEGRRQEDGTGEEAAGKRLMWGVTSEPSQEKMGHCSFSPDEVSEVRTGCLYAGRRIPGESKD
ncbi:hypothetical protein M011DRAFT_11578 [Sporormia fimetaria CBS 119925]|uniref:Uncharacterized protein n=1 Tax=Sporormia fimetaria CBS 119925 TaxID=1340428 RepID=A0A6A6VMX8_9PLEO|nr:hypothetical protein M011DRAFT_11578 [Sporormia fimetaria CBS 119925]